MDFKLGQEGKTMQNGTEATFKYTEDGETLKGVVTIPSKNRVIEDTYTVKQDELEVVCSQYRSNYGSVLLLWSR